MGHNLGLDHSGQGNEEYGDISGFMGYGNERDDSALDMRCFNGAKNWQLKWYRDRQLNMDVSNGPKGAQVDLIGLSEYEQATNEEQMVIVRVADKTSTGPDLYISYNRASGINSGVVKG